MTMKEASADPGRSAAHSYEPESDSCADNLVELNTQTWGGSKQQELDFDARLADPGLSKEDLKNLARPLSGLTSWVRGIIARAVEGCPDCDRASGSFR